MRKVIAAMNMTLDGYCDHDVMTADDEIHQHYADLLRASDTIVYGRITYQLMEDYWPAIVKNPTGNKPNDEFAITIDNISKLVFSHTLKHTDWNNSTIATQSLEKELAALRQQPGGDILIGSPGLIAEAMRFNLADEYQFSVHPVVAGRGLKLFRNIVHRIDLRLLKTKTFGCGAVLFYYAPAG